MLVINEPTLKLPIDNVGFCSHISSTNRSDSLTMYSFLVKEFIMGTKILARFCARVCKVNKIGRNGGSHLIIDFVISKVHT